ncbi:MAG: hypothetical protein LBQ66_03545, partial [Planctomycetaceae bacterium]|nr:hypothetical protein [Planctomycetaceae bacterium]
MADDTSVRFIRFKNDERYADPKSCAECHADICSEWKKSDHAKSMNHASEKTVLGDFNDVYFKHIGFDDILLLADDEVRELIRVIERNGSDVVAKTDNVAAVSDVRMRYVDGGRYPDFRYNIAGRKTRNLSVVQIEDLAAAVLDAKEGVLSRLCQNMSVELRDEFESELKFQKGLKFHRPGDIAIAHDQISSILRQLAAAGKIKTNIGTEFRMFRDANRFMVKTDVGLFEVRFTLGIKPLQQYLVETEKGKLQVLPVAWDTVAGRWFHLYPKEQIPKNDPLHWTAPVQNWNRMCADCHTTNLDKNYDAKSKTYNTTFFEINVGCQSCHGGLAKHVEVARKNKFLASWDSKIPKEAFSLSVLGDAGGVDGVSGGEIVVGSCAFCHSRRRLLQHGAKPPERSVADWFVPELIETNNYYPDGQLLDEAFEYGSFVQSKMYSKGVSCTNCHEPHTLELRYQGNRLCAQCHTPAIYDTKKHHFHNDAKKPGTQCVECHFPQSTYMVVDPRRDHSIRKPNPSLSIAAGVPNACTICHQNRKKGETLEWAQEHVERWYAEKRKATVGYSGATSIDEHYALAIIAGKQNAPNAVQKLIKVIRNKDNKEHRSAIRASAITLLSRVQVEHSVDEKTANDVLTIYIDSLTDKDVWVKLAAVGAFAVLPEELQVKYLTPLLSDPILAIRTEAARILAAQVSNLRNDKEKRLFEIAKNEYINSQYVNADQAASYLNLAVFERDLAASDIRKVQGWFIGTTGQLLPGDPAFIESQKTASSLIERLTKKPHDLYRQSLEVDGNFLPSRINLAMLYNERGDNNAAEIEFREALRIEPANGNTAYSLGLLLAEMGKFDEAIATLKRAAKNFEQIPDQNGQQLTNNRNAQKATQNRIRYNLGLLLLKLKRQ